MRAARFSISAAPVPGGRACQTGTYRSCRLQSLGRPRLFRRAPPKNSQPPPSGLQISIFFQILASFFELFNFIKFQAPQNPAPNRQSRIHLRSAHTRRPACTLRLASIHQTLETPLCRFYTALAVPDSISQFYGSIFVHGVGGIA